MPIPEYKAPENMTDDELLADLEKHHTPTEIPPCRVCGGKLSIASCGGGRPTEYRCSPYEDDPDRPGHIRPKKGRTRLVDDHYSQSAFTDYRHDDPAVLELVKRYRLFVRSGETVRVLEDVGDRGIGTCPGCGDPVDPEEPIPTVSKYGRTWHSDCAIGAGAELTAAGYASEGKIDRKQEGGS